MLVIETICVVVICVDGDSAIDLVTYVERVEEIKLGNVSGEDCMSACTVSAVYAIMVQRHLDYLMAVALRDLERTD